MNDMVYLAWQYLAYHRVRSLILVLSLTIIAYLPVGLNILVQQSSQQLRGRAEQTPLLIGGKGSPLELVLRSLYFETDIPPAIKYEQVARVDRNLATSIPIYARFRTRYGPIVGTTLDYFSFRDLRIASGRSMAVLGECVVGHNVASSGALKVGDSVLSASEDMFNLAGVYPLKMKIVGVLAPHGSPDDWAVFVDLKTAWVIEGLGHGHQDLSRPAAADQILRQEAKQVVANASVVQYNEITPENLKSFHFHGDIATYPLTAIIAAPHDEKASAILQGRYLGEDETVQVVRPAQVLDELLATVFTVGRYITIGISLVAISTLASMSLVFLLSIQLRRRELETMIKIGVSRWRVLAVLGIEIAGVLGLALLLAALLSAGTAYYADQATHLLLKLT